MTRSDRGPHPRLRLVGAAALAVALTGLGAPATGGGTASAAAGVTVEVGGRADFVAQTNFVQCVGASMQMMLNMVEPGRDRTAATQSRLQRLARAWSGPRPDGHQRQGASVRGWASGLNLLGAGPYRLVGEATIESAVATAARAIAVTGKPVGLLMWRGRHAWVMSGFTASADPRKTDDFRVTRVIVHDPLYPYGSKAWGPSPAPGASLTIAQLGRQFVARRTSSQWIGAWSTLGGTYVLVLPYEPDLTALRSTVR